jgi:predicted RNA-binding Zn ribbon-like protein
MVNLKERPLAGMKLIGGRFCLDFVNTIGGRQHSREKGDPYVIREERLNDYFDLLAWGLRVGFLSEPEARRFLQASLRDPADAGAVWKRAIALRESIYCISRAVLQGKSPPQSDLDVVNREAQAAHSRRILRPAKEGFVWEWDDTKLFLDRILWPIAVSAAELLAAADLTRLRQCPGEDCGWLFVDATRNRSRQWCDMKDCGNIAKVRRFRSRSH